MTAGALGPTGSGGSGGGGTPPREGSRGEPECEGGYHEEPPQQQPHPSESIGALAQ